MIWKKLTLILLVIVLSYLIVDYYRNWHNVDLAVNFIRTNRACDYFTVDECIDIRNLYIYGATRLLVLPVLILIVSMLIGFVVGRL